ncbi:MAG: hypothetical protein IT368_05350 [Candidatus Hydrogenedentes bacterium]|nr:hypothetical protein [Candidatus Hydrogenedentota bacterium]
MREKPAALALARGLALPAIAYPAALFLGGIPAALVALAVLASVLALSFFFAFHHEEAAQAEGLAIRGAVAAAIRKLAGAIRALSISAACKVVSEAMYRFTIRQALPRLPSHTLTPRLLPIPSLVRA